MILVALVCQAFVLTCVLRLFQGSSLGRTGVLFLLALVTYHGLGELLYLCLPDYNEFKAAASEASQEEVVVLFTFAIAAFAIAYTLASSRRAGFIFPELLIGKVEHVLRANALMLTVYAFICYAILGYYHLKYDINKSIAISDEYWAVGTAREFGLPLLILASVAQFVCWRRSPRALRLILIIQILFGLSTGQRALIVFPVIISLVTVRALKVSLRKPDIAVLAVTCALFAGLISVARAELGRERLSEMSQVDKLSLILSTAPSKADNSSIRVIKDFVYRFDANTSSVFLLEGLKRGTEPLYYETFLNSVAVVIPRFLNPNKATSDLTERNTEAFIYDHFGEDPMFDYNPGWLGYLLASFGQMGLVAAMAVWGLCLAAFDNRVQVTHSVFNFFIYHALIYNIVFYELTPAGFIVFFRGFLVIVLVVYVTRTAARALRLLLTQNRA